MSLCIASTNKELVTHVHCFNLRRHDALQDQLGNTVARIDEEVFFAEVVKQDSKQAAIVCVDHTCTNVNAMLGRFG